MRLDALEKGGAARHLEARLLQHRPSSVKRLHLACSSSDIVALAYLNLYGVALHAALGLSKQIGQRKSLTGPRFAARLDGRN